MIAPRERARLPNRSGGNSLYAGGVQELVFGSNNDIKTGDLVVVVGFERSTIVGLDFGFGVLDFDPIDVAFELFDFTVPLDTGVFLLFCWACLDFCCSFIRSAVLLTITQPLLCNNLLFTK